MKTNSVLKTKRAHDIIMYNITNSHIYRLNPMMEHFIRTIMDTVDFCKLHSTISVKAGSYWQSERPIDQFLQNIVLAKEYNDGEREALNRLREVYVSYMISRGMRYKGARR